MLSEDQKKQGVGNPGAPLPGLGGKPGGAPLPGLGGKPGAGPLPGLGGKPGAGGGLPGLGGLPGMKPSAAPAPAGGLPGAPAGGLPGAPAGGAPGAPAGGLPGAPAPAAAPKGPAQNPADPFGSMPAAQPAAPAAGASAGGALPGMKPGAAMKAVPPFLQPKSQPGEQEARQKEAAARAAQAAADQKIAMALSETSIDDAPMLAGKTKKTLIIGTLVAGLIGLGIGTLLGTGAQGRTELNIAIRDALIIEHELKEAGKLFNDVQTVVATALNKATKREYDPQHISFLKANLRGNPMPPTLLTERNYKKFDAAAVQWLVDYFKRWDRLYGLIQDHRRATEYDKKTLLAAKKQAQKLMETNYGVVFAMDKKGGTGFVGNVVIIGAGDGTKFQVQADHGTPALERALYNPEGEDSELTKEPDKWVVQLGPESKTGLLSKATQSHFKAYMKRLKEISDLMKGMTELQQNIIDKIAGICSQDPAWGADPDPEEGLEAYIRRKASAAAE